jgi:glycosyltransferase involved in cell wall biosynthesis
MEAAVIAIVVPAHNEEDCIDACLRSLIVAAAHPGLAGEAVEITVVLDACTDSTGHWADLAGVNVISTDKRNVGHARQLGAEMALAKGARWLAFTDADTVVSSSWLVEQLSLNADAVCGTVAVTDWGNYGTRMQRHFELTYSDIDGHRHIHGANLGVCAFAFQRAGGFASLTTGEDVALVKALTRIGANIAWSRAPRVFTSVRANFRAPDGFGETLRRIEELGQWVGVDRAVA